MRVRALETKTCYEKALGENPKLDGRMVVQLRVEDTADVTRIAIERDDVGHPGLRSCVVAVFARRMPTPAVGGCVRVAIPLNFKRKEPADAGQDVGL